jgi:ATP-dependent DNA helicase 2 subunit 1
MFEELSPGEVPIVNAIRCAVATFTDKIISSDKDLLGVVFYATAAHRNANDFENVFVCMDLDQPDAKQILALERLVDGGRAGINEALGGSYAGEFQLAEALWACSTMFSASTVKVGHRRIFLFTNDDDPNGRNASMRAAALQRARDLAELNIEIELFSMNRRDHEFDQTLFWSEATLIDDDELYSDPDRVASSSTAATTPTASATAASASKFEQLLAKVRRKEFRKRSLAKLPFVLADDCELAVRLYSLTQSAVKGAPTWLEQATSNPVKVVTKWICAQTGTLLMDSQISYYYALGDSRIPFAKDELAKIKYIDKPGIYLMGFKPRSALKAYHNIKHPGFIYPDESMIRGSTTAFGALLDRMLHLDRVAIARFTPRRNAQPRFVALLPHGQVLLKDGTQLSPPGLSIIPLPYAEDIRRLTLPRSEVPVSKQVRAAKRMVKRLNINFESAAFENPALQKHYVNLQAFALERDTTEDFVDCVLPQPGGFEKFQDEIDAFRNSVFSPDYNPETWKRPTASRKRAAPSTAGAKPPAAKRQAQVPEDMSALSANDIRKLTILTLKAYMKSASISAQGKSRKADLVAIVLEHLGKQ